MDSRNKLSGYNDRGEEIPDPRPTQLAIDFKAPPLLNDQIDRLVHNSMMQRDLDKAGLETFQEADDFEMDDLDPTAPYEESFDPLHTIAREQEIRAGFVEELSPEVLAKAREIVAQAKKKAEAINKPEPLEPKGESK